ncbi:Uncharacterised protein [Vibrio cholerae]|nr:Uncharacterised protein [Vibrio cholerae]
MSWCIPSVATGEMSIKRRKSNRRCELSPSDALFAMCCDWG